MGSEVLRLLHISCPALADSPLQELVKEDHLAPLQHEAAVGTAHLLYEMSEGVAHLGVSQAVELQLSRHSDHSHCVSLIYVTVTWSPRVSHLHHQHTSSPAHHPGHSATPTSWSNPNLTPNTPIGSHTVGPTTSCLSIVSTGYGEQSCWSACSPTMVLLCHFFYCYKYCHFVLHYQ